MHVQNSSCFSQRQFKTVPWLLGSDLRRLVSFLSAGKASSLCSLLYSFILNLLLGILLRNLHLDKRGFVLVLPLVSSDYWAGINMCNPTGLMSSPVTLILLKIHFLYPFSVFQIFCRTKYYWNKRNILTKLKWVNVEKLGYGSDSFSLLPDWFSL